MSRILKTMRSACQRRDARDSVDERIIGIVRMTKFLSVDLSTALETYRISRGAFTTNGIPTDAEIDEHLRVDAQILGLPASRVFDFSVLREVNQELGVK